MRLSFALAIASALSLAAAPAIAEPASLAGQSFGMVAGRLGGLGFGYRRFFDNGYGFGLGGIALYSPSDAGGKFSGNFGLQGYSTLHRTEWGRLYAMAGVSAFTGFADAFSAGAGLGIEVGFPHGVGAALDVPYAYASSQGLVMIPTLSLLYNF